MNLNSHESVNVELTYLQWACVNICYFTSALHDDSIISMLYHVMRMKSIGLRLQTEQKRVRVLLPNCHIFCIHMSIGVNHVKFGGSRPQILGWGLWGGSRELSTKYYYIL